MALDDAKPDQPSSGAQPDAPGSEAQQHKEMRTITDARTMRALAHPVRIAIIEALGFHGPMTATEVGEQIDESATTCSFHLRQLAKYGFVEEAGGGKGRARPWRLITLGFNIPSTIDDPEADIAAKVLTQVTRERQLARYMTWIETRGSYPREWRDAAPISQYAFYLTIGELEQLAAEVRDVLMRWFGEGERFTDPSQRPAESVPVELLLFGYPLEVPKPASAIEPSPTEASTTEASTTGETGTGETGEAEEGSR
jgi:DNA-binding transcriptional ArsR family regulator